MATYPSPMSRLAETGGELPTSSLRSKTFAAGIWSTLQSAGQEFVGFVTFFLLARFYLGEQEFGLVTLANSILMAAQVLSRFGLTTALIQMPLITERHKNAVFFGSVVFSLASAGAIFAVSPYLGGLVDNVPFATVLQVLLAGWIITFLGATHESLLRRELRFRPLAVRALISTFIGGSTAVAFAAFDAGVWSLVALNLVTACTSTILLWIAVDWRPRLTFSMLDFREILPMGWRITVLSTVNFLLVNSDRVLIGFLLGISELGLYYAGQRIVYALHRGMIQSINAVALPAFCQYKEDARSIRDGLLTSIRLCAALTLPVFFGIACLARQTIVVFLGSKWLEAHSVLAILAISSALQSLLYFNAPAMIALGRPGIAIKASAVAVPFMALFLIVGTRFGVTGVSFAVLALSVFSTLVWVRLLYTNLGVSARDFIAAIGGPLIAATIMAAVVSASAHMVGPTEGLSALAFNVILGFIVYAILIVLLDSEVRAYLRWLVGGRPGTDPGSST